MAWPPIQVWIPNHPHATRPRIIDGMLAPHTPNEARASTGSGMPYLPQGHRVDVTGKSVDVKGNTVDVKGNSVDVKGNSVDVKGNIVDVKENRVDVKGNIVDVKGISVDVKGNVLGPRVSVQHHGHQHDHVRECDGEDALQW